MSKIIIASLSALFFAVFSIARSYSIYETVKIVVLSIPLIIYIRGAKKERGILVVLSLILSFVLSLIVLSLIESSILRNADFSSSLLKAFSSFIYIIPLIILIDEDKRGVYLPLSIILSLLLYLPYSSTIKNYFYLYERVGNYDTFLLYSRIIIYCLISLPIEELIINRRRNYLSIIILLTLSMLSFLIDDIASSALFFLILLIYISRKNKVIEIEEKKKITLSRMETIEIEKLHKKKKEKVYETPPNLPIDDRSQNKNE